MTHKQIVNSVVVFGVLVLIAGFIYDDQPKPGPVPLAERCAELGGEWLYKSADLLCLMPDGGKLSYSPSADTFVEYVGGGVVAVAQASSGSGDLILECSTPPEFADYGTDDRFTGKAKVDFSTYPEATHHRTAITKDIAAGVNFAGAYVLSTWGCGDGCKGSAVINAESGKILAYGLKSSGYEFEDNSRLLDARREGYYVVDKDEFVKLCD